MNNRTFLLVVFYILSNFSYSQEFSQSSSTIRQWNVGIQNFFSPYDWRDTYILKETEDTTINGVHYAKLLKSFNEDFSNAEYIGSLRYNNDSLQMHSEGKDYLLYDFSMEVGDSLLLSYKNTLSARVDSIDLIDLSKIIRKRMYVSYSYVDFDGELLGYRCNDEWVQGVGSTRTGLFHDASYCAVGIEEEPHLLCYKENGELIYSNPDYDECFMATSMEELANETFIVYPNPTQELIYINSDDNLQIQSVELLNSSGQVLFSQTHCFSISLLGYNPGYYFVRIKTYDGKQKVVKITKY